MGNALVLYIPCEKHNTCPCSVSMSRPGDSFMYLRHSLLLVISFLRTLLSLQLTYNFISHHSGCNNDNHSKSDSIIETLDTNFGLVLAGIRGEYSPRPQQQQPPPIGGRGRGAGSRAPLHARLPLDRCDTKRISLRGRRGQVSNAINPRCLLKYL